MGLVYDVYHAMLFSLLLADIDKYKVDRNSLIPVHLLLVHVGR